MTTAPLMATTTLTPHRIEIDVNGPDPRRSPIASRFFRHWPKPCPAICGMEGPTGSGKTGTLFRKLWRLAQRMPVSPVDGMRHFKCVSVANTYRQLWRGPIPSFLKVLPKALGDWHGSEPDSPASFEVYAKLEDGTTLHYIHQFVAIGDRYGGEEELEEIFRGWEATVFHLVEMDTLPSLALGFSLNRAGRYPDVKHGLAPWYGVVFDLNAPRQTSWVYQKMLRDWTEGEQFFRQPPAILRDGRGGYVPNPDAENLENLPPGYYEGQIKNSGARMIRRFLAGEHMPDMRGKPVYGFFTDAHGNSHGHFDRWRHVARAPLPALRGASLTFGTDGGNQPGGWFVQIDPRTGQVQVVCELLSDHGTRERRYAEMIRQKLAGAPFDGAFAASALQWGADPSCFFGKDEKTGEGDWIWALEAALGNQVRFRPGGGVGNKLLPRIEVIANLLAAPDVAPGVPKFLISPTCPISIEALEGGYRFRQKQVNTEEPVFEDEPEKNHFSHLIEGGQYALLRMLGADAAFDPSRARGERRSGARASVTENNEDGNFYARRSGARAQRGA